MKQTVVLCIFLLFSSVYLTLPDGNAASDIGYKEFKLGLSMTKVKGIISSLYKNKDVKYLDNGVIVFNPVNNSEAKFIFDQNNTLYRIIVEVKYGEVDQLKNALQKKYGAPNDFTKEIFYSAHNIYLMGKWNINGKTQISLFQGEYCRFRHIIPCFVRVDYIDLVLQANKEKYDKGLKKELNDKIIEKKYGDF